MGKYGSSAKVCGIYKITNLKNNKIYIGQSKNIYHRRAEHFTALRRGSHPNKTMQTDWNLSKGRGFRWDVVEFCALGKLNEREEFWINYYNSIEGGYNMGWVPYKRKIKKQGGR